MLEAEIQALIDRLPIIFFVLDREDRFTKYRVGNTALAVPPERFLGRRIEEVFPPPLGARFGEALARTRASGERVQVAYEIPGFPGQWLADFAALPDGSVTILVSDVTERHAAEEALRERDRRFRTLIERATDVLYVLDPSYRVRFWSPGAAEALGWTADELEGRMAIDLVHPDDREVMGRPEEARSGESLRLAFRVRHRDGTYRLLDATVRNLLLDPAVGGVVVNARDVTEQRRLEARSAESAKLESIGRLAGGVAHDFNNLLTVILSCADMASRDVEAGARPAPEDLREILGAAERARALTRQLLAFARRQVIAPVVLDLNALVQESEKLLRRVLGEDVALAIRLGPEPWRVRCDPAQLQQVVLNLAVNARDALPRGGRLEIGTANVEVTPARAAGLPGLKAGPHVRLTVADDGPGLPQEIREHLFEPFFTTKAKGKGTGLGLATVYGIVSQSGGAISVESAPGLGTAFEIYLPRTEASVAEPELARAPGLRGGHETILLVEDDPAVGAVAARVLREAGSRVLHAQRGAEALTLAAEEPPQLLLTDVVMPGLDGRQVADAVGRAHPGTRVLFMSGYTEDAIVRHGVVEAGVQFLPKPFTPAGLLTRVREVLEGPPPR